MLLRSRFFVLFDGVDQGAHNIVIRDAQVSPVMIAKNWEGPIVTFGGETDLHINGECRLCNRDGSEVSIIHQYDRVPELTLCITGSGVYWRRTG